MMVRGKASVWAAALALALAFPALAEPGVSGTRATPPAKPGQTLPLRPTRRIAFDTSEGTAMSLDLSPDGRSIVFDLLGDIHVLAAGGGQAKAITRGMAIDSQPVFSPDGSLILFLSDRSGAENLWAMAADGSRARQLTFHDDNPVFVSPEWSADGKAIFVTRYHPDRNAYEMLRVDPGSGAAEVLVPNRTAPGQPRERFTHSTGAAPAADGRQLYYASRTGTDDFDNPGEWSIVRRDLSSGAIETVVKAVGDIRLGPIQSSAFRPALSPDGRWLAYGERRTGKTWLRLRNLGDDSDRVLTEIDRDSLQSSHWSDIVPRFDFTPDSSGLIVSFGGGIRRIAVPTGEIREIPFTARVDAELGPLVRSAIRQDTGPVRARLIQDPAPSPDGRSLAFSALGRIYVQRLDGKSPPRPRDGAGPPQFHPAWSPDGSQLAAVSWTAAEGGHVWIGAPKAAPRRLTTRTGFYTHPVFTPDGRALIVVMSGKDQRLATYMEFGQFREASLLKLPLDGAPPTVLATGKMGGTPHFTTDGTLYFNRPDGVHALAADGTERLIVRAVGPGWYFAEGAAAADDVRLSPDGKWALATIAQQLHLIAVPDKAGQSVDLSAPQVRHEKITDVGADFFGWADGGQTITWSVGSTWYRRSLDPRGKPQAFTAAVDVPRDVPRGSLLLRGGTAITMRGGEIVADADILVRDNHITAIGPRGSLAVPGDAAIREIPGKFVVPGYIDTHDHIADIRRDVLDLQPWGPAASLAYGVTTAFDPSSLSIDMFAYQDLVDSGAVTGSRIATTGPAVFSFNDFRSLGEVRAVLRRHRDHYRTLNLKQYRSGNRRVRQWIAQAARELGLTPTSEGALSFKLDLSHILDGYAGNEHALPPAHLYGDVTRLLAESGTANTLTLQITHGGAPAQDWFIARDSPHRDPKLARFTPPWFRDQKLWRREWRDFGDYSFAQVAGSAARVQRAGGVIGIGAHGEVPGLGTHWEMEAHALGGMTPLEVLRAATIGSARTIGRDAEFGSIEPGKYADLVVLNTDPRADIRNARDISWVIKNGRVYDAASLRELWPNQRDMAPLWFDR